MFSIPFPADMPPDYPEAACVEKAAADNRLPEEILWAIRIVEGGRRGLVSPNKDGSVDVGVMQINSTHFDYFMTEYGVKPTWLVHSQCISILAGGYRLAKEIKRSNDFWKGVGSYNSRTPSKNQIYQLKVLNVLKRHNYNKVSLMSEAQKRFSK